MIVDPISILYKDTVAQVIAPDGETDFFAITSGVLQGNTLAPYLFIVHWIMLLERPPKIHRPVLR